MTNQKKPMSTGRRERAIYMVGSVRCSIMEGIEIGKRGGHQLVDLNRIRTEETAGEGWPIINLKKESLVGASKVAARLAKEITHFIRYGQQLTEKDEWM